LLYIYYHNNTTTEFIRMNNFRENHDNEKNEKISRKKSKNKKNKKITKCDNSDSNNDNDVNIHKDKLYIAFKESIKKNKWYSYC